MALAALFNTWSEKWRALAKESDAGVLETGVFMECSLGNDETVNETLGE
jgi:hypothetical protein